MIPKGIKVSVLTEEEAATLGRQRNSTELVKDMREKVAANPDKVTVYTFEEGTANNIAGSLRKMLKGTGVKIKVVDNGKLILASKEEPQAPPKVVQQGTQQAA